MNKYSSLNNSLINKRRRDAIGSVIVNDLWTIETEFDRNIYLKKIIKSKFN